MCSKRLADGLLSSRLAVCYTLKTFLATVALRKCCDFSMISIGLMIVRDILIKNINNRLADCCD